MDDPAELTKRYVSSSTPRRHVCDPLFLWKSLETSPEITNNGGTKTPATADDLQNSPCKADIQGRATS